MAGSKTQASKSDLQDDEGHLPAFKADVPGLTCMTLEVPSVQSKDAWNSFLQLLSLADGIVILRIADEAAHDQEKANHQQAGTIFFLEPVILKDGYLAKSPLLAEVYEITESRPMFVVCVCKGPVRASLMTLPALSQLVVATEDSSLLAFGCILFRMRISFVNIRFGLPKYRHDLHPITSIALKKRLMDKAVRRLQLVGDPIDASEAQRLGLVDFVGSESDVENEICRSDRCKRFVNVNRQGGFGLRSLLASATVENQAMDKQQVARAQKKLDTNFAGRLTWN
eukprot:g15351.t1